MADEDAALVAQLALFVEEDQRRSRNPIFGARNAEQALLTLCERFKTDAPNLGEDTRQNVLKALQSMNLKPYRSYCREHLLDIGITNV